MAEKKYIELDVVIEAFDDPAVERNYGDVDPDSVIRVIETIPAADVRPVVRGKWVRKVEIDGVLKREYFVCSECGQTRMLNFHNFCPNCGADMRGNNG